MEFDLEQSYDCVTLTNACHDFDCTPSTIVFIDKHTCQLIRYRWEDILSEFDAETCKGTVICDTPMKRIVAGAYHYLTIGRGQQYVFSWSDAGGLHGQLGHGCMEKDSEETRTPRAITLLEGMAVTDVSAGDLFSAVVVDDALVYTL